MFTTDSIFHIQHISDLTSVSERVPQTGNAIAFFALCVSLLFLTILTTTYRKKTFLVFQSLFSSRIFAQLLRESKILNERIFLYCLAFIFPLQALFISTLILHFFPDIQHILTYPQLMLSSLIAVATDFVLKTTTASFVFKLYDYNEDRPNYILNKLFFHLCNSVFHLIILPIIIFSNSKYLFFAYIPILLTTGIFLIIRILSLNIRKIGLFHFFLYFCTFEILPYAIALKALALWLN